VRTESVQLKVSYVQFVDLFAVEQIVQSLDGLNIVFLSSDFVHQKVVLPVPLDV